MVVERLSIQPETNESGDHDQIVVELLSREITRTEKESFGFSIPSECENHEKLYEIPRLGTPCFDLVSSR